MSKINVYTKDQVETIKKEFSRLNDICYLDHAGATLYSEKQMENIYSDFSKNVYANPHAYNTSSQITKDIIDIVRYRILTYFNTSLEEYSVVFTSGATQSLKIVAESFDFNGGSLVYLEDNHTSVLGMRNLAPSFRELKVSEAFNILSGKPDSKNRGRDGAEENCLFVYPAESNFSGTKYPLHWVELARNGVLSSKGQENTYTLLDAACFASSNDLNLEKVQPDFITISFYKIFGYPTGLGAILVRRQSEKVLRKKYLGGGTVLMALSSENVMIPRQTIQERFEDGTVSFLSILSLVQGFETLKRLQLTPELISHHTFNIAHYVFEKMSELHHSNGEPVAILYHDSDFLSIDTQGGIINFNLKRNNGDYVGFAEVLHIANLHKIQLRTGCFCNPGACQKFLKLTAAEVRKQFEKGHVCGDQNDLIDGRPTGSVRISFGYMSTFEDADAFLNMIESCFITFPVARKQRPVSESKLFKKSNKYNMVKSILESNNQFRNEKKESISLMSNNSKITGELVKIYLYPVKSCGAFEVKQSWKLTNIGLEYDRRWMIVNASGSCVSQKDIKSLCTLKPTLDLVARTLKLRINDSEMVLPLDPPAEKHTQASFCNSKVCGDKVQGFDCGDKIADWLTDHLERPGLRLLRQCDFTENKTGRSSTKGRQMFLSLANKAEYLLVNLATVRWLQERIPQEDVLCHSVESVLLRFRANFVVDFAEPFAENDLAILLFNDVPFKFSGHCTRCQMICIDQETGEISKEPLQTLSRELQGKMRFGVYLSQNGPNTERRITTGCIVNGFAETK